MNSFIRKTLYILAILSLWFFLYFGLYFVDTSIDLNGTAKFSVDILVVMLWANINTSLIYFRRISRAYEIAEQDNSGAGIGTKMNSPFEKTLYIFAIASLCFFLYCGLYFVEISIGLNRVAKFSVDILIVMLWANIIASLRYFRRISVEYEAAEQGNSGAPNFGDTINDSPATRRR